MPASCWAPCCSSSPSWRRPERRAPPRQSGRTVHFAGRTVAGARGLRAWCGSRRARRPACGSTAGSSTSARRRRNRAARPGRSSASAGRSSSPRTASAAPRRRPASARRRARELRRPPRRHRRRLEPRRHRLGRRLGLHRPRLRHLQRPVLEGDGGLGRIALPRRRHLHRRRKQRLLAAQPQRQLGQRPDHRGLAPDPHLRRPPGDRPRAARAAPR